MTIKQAQQSVDKWINTTGVRYFSELTNMALLTEEVGEVARIISRTYGEQSFKKTDKDKNLADELAEVGKSTSLEDKIDHLLAVIACHSSVRAGKTLSEPEIQALLREMDESAFPGQCPHGRPALWKIPLREMEKKFSR